MTSPPKMIIAFLKIHDIPKIPWPVGTLQATATHSCVNKTIQPVLLDPSLDWYIAMLGNRDGRLELFLVVDEINLHKWLKTQFDILNVMEVELMYKSKMALVIMVLVQIPTAVVTCASLPEACTNPTVTCAILLNQWHSNKEY